MLRNIQPEELSALYHKRITRDFPPNEHPPLAVLRRYLKTDLHDGFFYVDEDGKPAGYALCAAGKPDGCALITLLAAFEERRSGGIGTRLLADLAGHYAQKRALLIEVERPELAKNEKERALRERRIAFYERAGYRALPRLDYKIFGVPMRAMALPLREELKSDEVYATHYREIYSDLLSPLFRSQLSIKIRDE